MNRPAAHTAQHADCPPVHDEFGSAGGPVDPTLMGDDFRDVVADVTAQLVARPDLTGTYDPRELANGKGAQRVLHSLGCASCDLTGVCGVQNQLVAETVEGAAAERREMLASAPRWLAAGRLQRAKVPADRLDTLLTSPDRVQMLSDMGVSLDDLLGGVQNTFAGVYNKRDIKQDIPELATITTEADQMIAHNIVTSNGHTLVVLDAAESSASRQGVHDKESVGEYVILCGKLLGRMVEVGPDGLPQILHQDMKMQKTISAINGGTLFEMRMNGKDRLYFTVVRQPEGERGPTARIVLLGSHGGDERTQQEFINRLLSR